MSHVATIEIEIRDLDALARAAKRCGLEFVKDQTTYIWYGRSVGDYPLPEGFTEKDLGRCLHALRVPPSELSKGQKTRPPYEVGVVERRDGKPGYMLQWDFYAGGYGLEKRVGKDCQRLRQAYGIEVAKAQAQRKGFRVTEQVLADGSVDLIAEKH